MCVILRLPSCRRDTWQMMFTADASWMRSAASGMSTSLIIAIVSRREVVSRGYVAWSVDMQPP